MQMSYDQDSVGILTKPDHLGRGVAGPSFAHHQRASSTSPAFGPEPYLEVARALLPRWVRILEPTSWSMNRAAAQSPDLYKPLSMYQRQAATLAVAILCEYDPAREDHARLREIVRTSLVRWQLALLGDGRPIRWRSRNDSLFGPTVASIAKVLCECSGFQNGSLLSDMQYHLAWLARRPPSVSWMEAATICGMADAAVLLRDKRLWGRARVRLAALLATQDDEGWFHEPAGADIGGLSLTIDALARLGVQNDWMEVEEPLARALRFLVHFVHPDGSVGGCFGTCGTGFLTSYGIELLAQRLPEAASLACTCRQQFRHLDDNKLAGLSDELVATWGSSAILAATLTQPGLSQRSSYPCESTGHARFPRAGLSIFSTDAYYAVVNQRAGGAIRVTWKNGAPSLSDSGITIVCSRRICTGFPCHGGTDHRVTGSSVTCTGPLRAPARPRSFRPSWLPRLMGRRGRRRGETCCPAPPGRLPRDSYKREIKFGSDWIEIGDEVHCHTRVGKMICHWRLLGPDNRMQQGPDQGECTHWPVFTDLGQRFRITRRYAGGRLTDQRVDGGSLAED